MQTKTQASRESSARPSTTQPPTRPQPHAARPIEPGNFAGETQPDFESLDNAIGLSLAFTELLLSRLLIELMDIDRDPHLMNSIEDLANLVALDLRSTTQQVCDAWRQTQSGGGQ